MSTRRRVSPPSKAGDTESPSGSDLASAAEILFGSAEQPIVLRDGRKVVVQAGKVKHVGLLLDFFNALIENLDKKDIITLVSLIEQRQTGAEALAGLSVEKLVGMAFDRSSLLVALFQATYHVLPPIVGSLTNLSREEFDELDVDEGAVVAVAVFQLNYSFFSRNLPAAMRGFLALAAKKMVAR